MNPIMAVAITAQKLSAKSKQKHGAHSLGRGSKR
jgi:hypothetical protein